MRGTTTRGVLAALVLTLVACGGSRASDGDATSTATTAAGPTVTPTVTVGRTEATPTPSPASTATVTASAVRPGSVPAPAAGPPRTLTLQPALGGRRFERPTEVGAYPGGRMFVAEQAGTIEVFAADGTSHGVLLDIRSQVSRAGNEEGFLGVAFAPGYPGTPHVFVYYSVAGGERRTRLARFEVERDRALPGSELVILEQPQPFSNHKGGALRFGPDGMLYVGLGDGGSQGDPSNRAQDLGQWLGKVLRLDVRYPRVGRTWDVLPDNPFVGRADARPEVWAYGFRNPWRISFDPATGALWAADVGQNNVEEIDVVERGANLGWRRFEGNDCYRGPCEDRSGLTFPVATYTHAEGCSVTGGVVYRGRAVPALVGWYLYADYCSGRVWAVPSSGGAPVALLGQGGARSVTSFGTDEVGEVYLAVQGGAVLRVVGAG